MTFITIGGNIMSFALGATAAASAFVFVSILNFAGPGPALAGALFFGFLRSGGISMEIMAGVPSALTVVIQGLIVIAVAGSVILVEKLEGGQR